MTPKMFLNCTRFANESQINLLVPDEDVEDAAEILSSTAEEMPLRPNCAKPSLPGGGK